MTIAISVKVNDGVVLATDSASTIIAQDSLGNISIQNVYKSADKIFNLDKHRPIGVMTWGVGSIGNESIATLMKDLRARITGQDEAHADWTLAKEATVLQFAEAVKRFVFEEKYQPAFATWPQKPALGFLVAGFSPQQSLAEEYQIDIFNGDCADPRPVRPQDTSGIVWNGEPEAISRLLLGYSPHLIGILSSELGFTPEQIQKVQGSMSRYTAQVAIAPMPIQDAISLAEFLVDTTINYSRFSPGPTTVDGPIEIAAITKHEGFKWVKRKHYFSPGLNPPPPPKEQLKERRSAMHTSYAVNRVDSPLNTTSKFEYIYKPYETGTITYSDDKTTVEIRVQVDDDSSLATMIASEAVLARDWDTPEEDEAWANL